MKFIILSIILIHCILRRKMNDFDQINTSLNSALGVKEMRKWKVLLKQLFAEFLGTFLFLVFSPLLGDNRNLNQLTVAIANGLLVASIMQIFGNVSGGHINPAVTLGVMVYGSIKPLRAICFIVVQVAGSIAGAAVAYGLSQPTIKSNLGVTLPRRDLKIEQALGIELLMTFVLVSVCLSVLDYRRGARGLGSAALAVGFSLTACQCAGLSYTGASLSPVRSLGPAVIMNIWSQHWLYWAGPMLGGLLAGIVYRCISNMHTIFV